MMVHQPKPWLDSLVIFDHFSDGIGMSHHQRHLKNEVTKWVKDLRI